MISRFLVLIAATCLLPQSAAAAPRIDPARLADRAEIAALIRCYARGTDAIGNAAVETDPESAGLEILETCFTEDATFAVWPAGTPFDSLVFPERTGDEPPALMVRGPAAWAAATNAAFRGAGGVGYDFVQHNISNIDVEVSGAEGRLTAYLSSVHVIQGAPGTSTRCRREANGVYSVKAGRVEGRWLITHLDLAQIAYDAVIENGDGCSRPR